MICRATPAYIYGFLESTHIRLFNYNRNSIWEDLIFLKQENFPFEGPSKVIICMLILLTISFNHSITKKNYWTLARCWVLCLELCVISFATHKNHVRYLLLTLFYKTESWGSEKLGSISTFAQSDRLCIWMSVGLAQWLIFFLGNSHYFFNSSW